MKKYINNILDTERNTLHISDDEKRFTMIDTLTVSGGQTITPVVRYQYDNHLGSACLELDNTGQIISYEEYHPFGTTSYRSGRSQTEVSLKRYKYCGKERDEETGLYYYGMRYYVAWICRFVSVDPLQFKYPYYTPYQYAGNKPITYIDLDGGEEKDTNYQKDLIKKENVNNIIELQNNDIFISPDHNELLQENLYKVLTEIKDELIKKDSENNNREYGGLIGIDANGNIKVVWAKPGKEYVEGEKLVGINVFDSENEEERKSLVYIIGAFHSHPSKYELKDEKPKDLSNPSTTTLNFEAKINEYSYFKQLPSYEDVKNAQNRTEILGYSFVFAMRIQKVFRYNRYSDENNIKDSIGDINFSDLSKWERLYSNQNKNWRLKFYKSNLDED